MFIENNIKIFGLVTHLQCMSHGGPLRVGAGSIHVYVYIL